MTMLPTENSTVNMKKIAVGIQSESEDCIPFYASEGAAGADLKAFITENVTIAPGETALIPTGIKLEIPAGYELQIRPRSGLALKFSVTVLNTPGTIDADYRGEIKVILINHGKSPFTVEPNMRIAQGVLAEVVQANFFELMSFSSTSRGDQGFGHTGFTK